MSILNVNNVVEKTSGHGVKIAGHVVQTVFVHSTTRTAVSSSTYTNVSLTKAITPKYSDSLIYIQISSGYNTEASGRRIDVTIERTATGLTTEFLHELEGLATNQVTYQMKARENISGATIEIPSSNDQTQCMVIQEIAQ